MVDINDGFIIWRGFVYFLELEFWIFYINIVKCFVIFVVLIWFGILGISKKVILSSGN